MLINNIRPNKVSTKSYTSPNFGCELRVMPPVYHQIRKIAKSEGHSSADILESFQSLKTFVKEWNTNHEKIAQESINKQLEKNINYKALKDKKPEEIVRGSVTGKFNINTLKNYPVTAQNPLDKIAIAGNINGDSIIFLTNSSQKSSNKDHKNPKKIVESIKAHIQENFNNFIEDSMDSDSFFRSN